MRRQHRPSLVQIMACRLVGRQAIIGINAGILSIGPLGRDFSEISIKIQTFHSRKCFWNIVWKMVAILSRGRGVNLGRNHSSRDSTPTPHTCQPSLTVNDIQSRGMLSTYIRSVTIDMGASLIDTIKHEIIPLTLYGKWPDTTVSIRVINTGTIPITAIDTGSINRPIRPIGAGDCGMKSIKSWNTRKGNLTSRQVANIGYMIVTSTVHN